MDRDDPRVQRPVARRRYRRITVRIDVSYLAMASGAVSSAIATTLGAGGLFVRTDSPLPPGAPLRVRFKLPGGEREHELVGRVVWANDVRTPGVPASGRGMGVAFRDPHAQARLARDLAALDAPAPDADGR